MQHTVLPSVREFLGEIDWVIEGEAKLAVKIATLGSSGTIKTLTHRLGILVERRR